MTQVQTELQLRAMGGLIRLLMAFVLTGLIIQLTVAMSPSPSDARQTTAGLKEATQVQVHPVHRARVTLGPMMMAGTCTGCLEPPVAFDVAIYAELVPVLPDFGGRGTDGIALPPPDNPPRT